VHPATVVHGAAMESIGAAASKARTRIMGLRISSGAWELQPHAHQAGDSPGCGNLTELPLGARVQPDIQ
jgi:hypothetical protein